MAKELFSNRTLFEKCYLVENVKQLSFIPGNRNLRMAHVKRIFKAFLDGEWLPPIYVLPNGEGKTVLQHFVCLRRNILKTRLRFV